MSGLMGAGLPKQQQPQQEPQQEQSSAACGCIVLVVVLGVFIALFFWACSACGGDGGGGGAGGSGGSYGYTLADYQRIDIGMSRSEVKSILGGNGEPVDGYPHQRIYINDADYSNIVVVYQGDVVVDKAQAGL